LAAVTQNGYLFQYVVDSLKQDEEIALAAIAQCARRLRDADDNGRGDVAAAESS